MLYIPGMKMPMLDIIVLVITVTICVNISIDIYHVMFSGEPYNEDRADHITDIINQMIAVVILYVGSKLRQNDDE